MNILIEQLFEEEWIEHIITFLSVFLGAYFAYHFSIHQDNQKDKKQQIENYNILWNKVALSQNNLFTYKEVYLDRIKQAFEKNDFDEALKTSYVLDCDFSFDDHHYFLNLYKLFYVQIIANFSKKNYKIIYFIRIYILLLGIQTGT